MLPQTWENSLIQNDKGYYGDNDPLDIVELSEAEIGTGEVRRVKVLGSLELID
jgi:inorganic pyrophosphatase